MTTFVHLVTAALAISGWLAAWHFHRSRNAWRNEGIEALWVGMEREELRRERDKLKAENARLRNALAEKLTAESVMTALNYTPKELFTEFEGGPAGLLAMAFFEMAQPCENYIECEFSNQGKHIVVTVQKPDKKTPHQLRKEAEAERDAFKVKLESAVTQCKGWRKACQHVGEEAGDTLSELYRVREENERLKAELAAGKADARQREIEANLKPSTEVDEAIDSASTIVATWPEWKQNVLGYSAKPTRDEPRKSIFDPDKE